MGQRGGAAAAYAILLLGLADAVSAFMSVPPMTAVPGPRPATRRPCGHLGMLGGAEAAAAGFALGNVAYVAQLLAKPRQRSDGDPYALLRGLSAYRASDGALVPVTSAWSADQKAVVVLMRSFG